MPVKHDRDHYHRPGRRSRLVFISSDEIEQSKQTRKQPIKREIFSDNDSQESLSSYSLSDVQIPVKNSDLERRSSGVGKGDSSEEEGFLSLKSRQVSPADSGSDSSLSANRSDSHAHSSKNKRKKPKKSSDSIVGTVANVVVGAFCRALLFKLASFLCIIFGIGVAGLLGYKLFGQAIKKIQDKFSGITTAIDKVENFSNNMQGGISDAGKHFDKIINRTKDGMGSVSHTLNEASRKVLEVIKDIGNKIPG